MAQEPINNLPQDGGTGDSLFIATTKINNMFTELYSLMGNVATDTELSDAVATINTVISILQTETIHTISDITGLQTALNALVSISSFNSNNINVSATIIAINAELLDIITRLGAVETNTFVDAPLDGQQYAREDGDWSVINIPTTAVPNLQQVLVQGNTTNIPIIVSDTNEVNESVTIQADSDGGQIIVQSGPTNIIIQPLHGGIIANNQHNGNTTLNLFPVDDTYITLLGPVKQSGTYTIATTDDIIIPTIPTLQTVTNTGALVDGIPIVLKNDGDEFLIFKNKAGTIIGSINNGSADAVYNTGSTQYRDGTIIVNSGSTPLYLPTSTGNLTISATQNGITYAADINGNIALPDIGKITITDLQGQAFANLADAKAYVQQFTAATITNESFSHGVYKFTVPSESDFSVSDFFCGDDSSTQNIKFEDPYGLVVSLGISAFSGNDQDNILGFVTFGNDGFVGANPPNKNTIAQIIGCGTGFANNYTGRADVGKFGTDGNQNLSEDLFTTSNLAWINTPYSNKFNNSGSLDKDLQSAKGNMTNPNKAINFEGIESDNTDAVSSVAGRIGAVVLDTSDVTSITNKRYVTDANLVTVGNQSGVNTGDETLATIKSKLGITALSGVNTGDQDLSNKADLDINGKVPLSQMNDALLGNVHYQGLYDVFANIPNLTTVETKGHYYICTTAKNRFGIDYQIGDWVISDGTVWGKVDNTDAVASVAGRTGNIVLDTSDVTAVINKRYITDSNLTLINNTSGVNTGDETLSSIKTKLGIATLSGANTGDQDLSGYQTISAATFNQYWTKISNDIYTNLTGNVGIGTSTPTQGKFVVYQTSSDAEANVLVVTNNTGILFRVTGQGDVSSKRDITAGGDIYGHQIFLNKIISNDGLVNFNLIAGTGVNGITTTNAKIKYTTDLSPSYDDRTLVDKGYVSAAISAGVGAIDLSSYETISATTTSLATKVDKVVGKQLSTNDYTTAEQTKVSNLSGTNTGDETLATIKSKLGITTLSGNNTGDQDLSSFATTSGMTTSLATKVDKVSGKGLSTNDYTTAEQTKLAGVATNANVGVLPNTAIVAATHTKITYDTKGLILSGVDLVVSDIPSLTASKITDFDTQVATTALIKSNNLSGLTNPQTARVNIGLDKRTTFGDVNYTALITDREIATSVVITAPRTVTLITGLNAGAEIIVADELMTVSATNTLTIAVQTGKYLNGVLNGTEVIGNAGGWRRLFTDGNGNYFFDAGQMRISKFIGTTLTADKVVITDANSKFAPSTVTSTELGYVGGVTSAIQTQINTNSTNISLKADKVTITGASKTKITYNSQGIITSGADATTADILDSIGKRYVTDANLVTIGNQSGTNSGDNAVNSLYSGIVSNATHTGDATGSVALTLATVNSNIGTLGSASKTVTVTTNAKGLTTAIVEQPIAITESQVTGLVSDLAAKESTANKDATGGYAGLTLFKINFKNSLNTITSFFTNANTVARTYTFQDRNGVIADDTDLALKSPVASPTFTGTVNLPATTIFGAAFSVTGGVTTNYITGNGTVRSFLTDVRGAAVTPLTLTNSAVVVNDSINVSIGKLQAQINSNVIIGVNNATTTILTNATLTSTYPSATTGFRVYCTSIIAGSMVYEKTPTTWIGSTTAVTP